jgi:hypothetical protein
MRNKEVCQFSADEAGSLYQLFDDGATVHVTDFDTSITSNQLFNAAIALLWEGIHTFELNEAIKVKRYSIEKLCRDFGHTFNYYPTLDLEEYTNKTARAFCRKFRVKGGEDE